MLLISAAHRRKVQSDVVFSFACLVRSCVSGADFADGGLVGVDSKCRRFADELQRDCESSATLFSTFCSRCTLQLEQLHAVLQ